MSKSGVSRRYVKAAERALPDLMSAGLSGLDLVAFMVEGVHCGEHVCVVALALTIDGTKVPLVIEEVSDASRPEAGARPTQRLDDFTEIG
jgi:putative transposase